MPEDPTIESTIKLIEMTKAGTLSWVSDPLPTPRTFVPQVEYFTALLKGMKIVLTHYPNRIANVAGKFLLGYDVAHEQVSDTLAVFNSEDVKLFDFPQTALISGLYKAIKDNQEQLVRDFLSVLESDEVNVVG